MHFPKICEKIKIKKCHTIFESVGIGIIQELIIMKMII